MSNKYTQESHGSYTEGLRVKISERYKPPAKINLIMSYSQRLNISEQIRLALPTYQFMLEDSVKKRIGEWRTARSIVIEQMRNRLDKARNEMQNEEKELLEAKTSMKEKDVEIDCINENAACTDYSDDVVNCKYSAMDNSNSQYNASLSNVLYGSPTFSSGSKMLIPTRASIPSYANILTPIPSTNQNYDNKPLEDSPFNISDFEADTSSPFDNMELKSINEMEELARVLKTDDSYEAMTPFYTSYHPMQSVTHNQANYPSYQISENHYNYNIPTDTTYSQPRRVMSTLSNTKGYYYRDDHSLQRFCTSHPFSSACAVQNVTSQDNAFIDSKKPLMSIPDIMDSLQTRLDTARLDNSTYSQADTIESGNSGKSNAMLGNAVQPELKLDKEEVEDPFLALPKNLQDLSKSISSMGFPLPMVARTCKHIGYDHKKIVEHLLAMTELLDLGFPEQDVSGALLACNNDRDKALDKLIS